MTTTECTAIVSGGMDSATLAYWLVDRGHNPHVLSFDYGQRHRRELDAAREIADRLGAPFDLIDISPVQPLLKGSSLTDPAVPTPHGHYAEESMRQTVVPNRNAIMLSIAWGVATANGHVAVATAVHGGDHYIYPDCRPAFVSALNHALRLATIGHRDDRLHLLTPFLEEDKTEIARTGHRLGVPFEITWTCYDPQGDAHCGHCGACNERKEAFRDAGIADAIPAKLRLAA